MSTVWIVTEGSYSDYKILAVYDTEEAARGYVSVHEGAGIETWELNTPGGQRIYEFWELCVKTGRRGPNDGTAWKFWDIGKPMRREWDITEPLDRRIRDYGHSFYVTADTKDQALKIAQDEVARRKAIEAGVV